MRDFVSNRWIRVVGLAALMSVVWAMFILQGFPWMGLVGVGLAFSAALWVAMRSPRSMSQVIADIEAEPVRVAAPVAKAVL